MKRKRVVFDIEANGFLENHIDYTASPYRLKDSFVLHCIVAQDVNTGEITVYHDGEPFLFDGRPYKGSDGLSEDLVEYEPIEYKHKPLKAFGKDVQSLDVVGHNIIEYDLLALSLVYGFSFDLDPEELCGSSAKIDDTLVLAKTLNPDLKSGYSLDALGKMVGGSKWSFRKSIPEVKRFEYFDADMLYYCIQDVLLNAKLLKLLELKLDEHGCYDAYQLEKTVKHITSLQKHRGFFFRKDVAEKNVEWLDKELARLEEKIAPILPKKRLGKTALKQYTPPARQFKKDGTLSKHMEGFIVRHGGKYEDGQVILYGKTYPLPLPNAPIKTEENGSLKDSTFIKQWLMEEYGWEATEWDQREITTSSKDRTKKLTDEQWEKAVTKYLEKPKVFLDAISKLLKTKDLPSLFENHDRSKPLWVPTTPSFTVGQVKEPCPNLVKIAERVPAVEVVYKYYTYKHRRSAILGSKFELGEDAEKGYLSQYREEDGRIPTPADSCGTSTARFKHRGVANIPRTTSLFGKEMRAMFGVDTSMLQIGYDFDSLEARIEAHYCWVFDKTKEYCLSLIQEKPNDVHTKTAAQISEILEKEFKRPEAKTVKYACTYGARVKRLAKTLGVDIKTAKKVFDAFWKAAAPLKRYIEWLERKWEKDWEKKYVIGLDGRRVPTRAKHALANSTFQNAGVVCAKRAMVIHRQLLKKYGLYIDFFKDNWKTRQFCSQMIAYHDEAQLEVSKSLVKGKRFDSKEEALTWKKEVEKRTGKILSDVDNENRVGYSLPGELAVRAVQEAGKYYNLNIELTAGYIIGTNWAECH